MPVSNHIAQNTNVTPFVSDIRFDFRSLSWIAVFIFCAVILFFLQPSLPFAFVLSSCLAISQLTLANMTVSADRQTPSLSSLFGAMLFSSLLYGALLIAHIFLGSYGVVAISLAAAFLFVGLIALEMMMSFTLQFVLPFHFSAPIRCANQIDTKYGGLLGTVR